MAVKIQTLQTFVTVAESGNLVDAAARLHRTPSAVSMALKQLEEHLGRPLFEADRKAQLTPMGLFALQHSRQALEHFGRSVRAMERYARGEGGTVRVACVPSVATRLLPAVLRHFRAAHRGVEVDVRDMDSESVCDSLRLGRIDLGIASHGGGGHGFDASTLLRDPFGVVCSAHHPLAKRRRALRWRDLAGCDLIANGTCRAIADPELQALLRASALTVRNTTSLVALVAADAGVTVLPRLAVEECDGAVCFRPLARPVPYRELLVLRRAGVTPTPALEAFQAALAAVARTLPGMGDGGAVRRPGRSTRAPRR